MLPLEASATRLLSPFPVVPPPGPKYVGVLTTIANGLNESTVNEIVLPTPLVTVSDLIVPSAFL